MAEFLPINQSDMNRRGWTQCDFVYVVGDAYVDHPSFGHAIISRVLESHGYKVGIISQPDWKNPDSISILGEPRLGFLVCGGNMDSMVNHYSVSRRHRKTDAYTPGGITGKRPDYAVTVYCNLIRQRYKKAPIIIGGIEASLRRLAHYDYWSDKLKRSVLLDAQADLLIYGMGERAIVEIADALNDGMDIHDITYIDGTVFKVKAPDENLSYLKLPSYPELQKSKRKYAESFYLQYQNTDPFSAKRLLEPYSDHEFVVQNPPQKPLSQQEMDAVYDLPYCRTYHPSYEALGGVPAISEIQFSLTSCRGCFGACNFCALTFHQGRIIQSRSHASLLKEACLMTREANFKGYIHDVGGPTADFRQPACKKQLTRGACQNRQCLFPSPCKNLVADHSDYLALLRKLRAIPGVKKVFIRSGLRFDYNTQPILCTIGLAAACSGGVMGDHCSPISDTTIMASAGAHCFHLNHVFTQLPYALTVAGVAFVSFILAGLIQNVIICLIIACALMVATLLVIKVIVAKKHAGIFQEMAEANKALAAQK